ncbi:MAG: hypothetical protein II825_05770 [Paludibacteraceae bacterium]|nr:hypothetical protein [Paludibacteraceae bacterium]
MKRAFNILALLCAIILTGCNTNPPELNDNNRKLLLGNWQVVKETMTNGDGFGGVVTRTENFHWGLDSYDFLNDSLVFISNSGARYLVYVPPYNYSLAEQKDGKWLLTVPELYDTPRNLEGGLSPITIHKLSKNTMEWQFESYGGDEGPVVYYQYLKKIEPEIQQ